jgi:hypothetical protein
LIARFGDLRSQEEHRMAHIYGNIDSKTDLERVFREIRKDGNKWQFSARASRQQSRSKKNKVWAPTPAPTSKTDLPTRSSPSDARCSSRR